MDVILGSWDGAVGSLTTFAWVSILRVLGLASVRVGVFPAPSHPGETWQ